MENASKALIIAGAILISIVLITIGVIILNQGQGKVDKGGEQLDKEEISSFNQQFTKYEGTSSVPGTKVKALISEVQGQNSSLNNHGADMNDRGITIDGSAGVKTEADNKTKISGAASIKPATKYTVEISGYSTEGYINKITINNK